MLTEERRTATGTWATRLLLALLAVGLLVGMARLTLGSEESVFDSIVACIPETVTDC